jgi:hypothetical protein
MGCNINGWITSNTGWTNFVHLETAGGNLCGDSTGSGTNNYGHDSPTHPVCVTPP